MEYRDKNYNVISKFDRVLVPDPNESDSHNHEFAGTVMGFQDGYVIVEDDDCSFMLEPERLEIIGDNE